MFQTKRRIGKKRFQVVARDHVEWRRYALDLWDAALVLEAARKDRMTRYLMKQAPATIIERDLFGAVSMLAGLALECLFKSRIVACKPEEVAADGTARRIAGHDLQKLYLRAKVKVSREERKALGVLTRAVLWEGRYPVAMEPKKMAAGRGKVLETVVRHAGNIFARALKTT